MKSTPEIDAAAAFPDPMHLPGERDLAAALGAAFQPLREFFHRLHAAHPQVTSTWQYSPRVGWYQIQSLGKRRLLYLVPKRRDFRLTMILGGKAEASLCTGPACRRIAALFQRAPRYVEGTMICFDRTSAEAAILTALVEAKIAPGPTEKRTPARRRRASPGRRRAVRDRAATRRRSAR
jgi:hypothetical protein